MKKNNISNKIDYNKSISKIKKQAQFKCCFWGEKDNDSNDCSEGIISAHSIQRGKILDSISENGKVSYLTCDPSDDLSKMNPTFNLEGIKKFSTFYGFCGKHDKEVFQPIEDRSFEGTEEQLNIYAYRSISKELYAQNLSLRKNKLLLGDAINETCPPHYLMIYPQILEGEIIVPEFIKEDIIQKVFQEKLRQKIKGIEINIKELSLIEEHLRNVIKKQESCLIKHQTYIFDYEIPIACSGVFFLYKDPLGKSVISESDTKNEAVNVNDCKNTILNVFPENGKTYVIFSTIKNNKKVVKFIDKLISDNDDIDWMLSHVILNHIENIAFRPSYIQSFSNEERDEILNLFFHNLRNTVSIQKSSVSIFKKY